MTSPGVPEQHTLRGQVGSDSRSNSLSNSHIICTLRTIVRQRNSFVPISEKLTLQALYPSLALHRASGRQPCGMILQNDGRIC